MKAIKIGASWCSPPEDAEPGQHWTCPECSEHWTALPMRAAGEPQPHGVLWEQTWVLDAWDMAALDDGLPGEEGQR